MNTTPQPVDTKSTHIVRQLDANLERHAATGDAFVVSVYGEWGIGKTRCLRDIADHYTRGLSHSIQNLDAPSHAKLIIPVIFEAWRYEHEEHLVVPLLKTIEYKLREIESQIQDARQQRRTAGEIVSSNLNTLGDRMRRAGRVVGDLAVALASGFKLKLAPLSALTGVDFELSVKDVLEKAVKTREWSETPSATTNQAISLEALSERAQKLESLYFDSGRTLEALTEPSRDGNSTCMSLSFVVLIDDLDRCLPEKAVQVLESVKLFLNVKGFCFVLAVDDEVVERGISHRYRDYLLQEPHRHAGDGRAPISGAEYLEKIVHLPVYLPRWTDDEARRFLQGRYPTLFVPPSPPASGAADHSNDQRNNAESIAKGLVAPMPDDGNRDVRSDADSLMDLIVTSIPLVPRKLIRLAEGLAFHQKQFEQLSAPMYWRPRQMIRLVALQQLYPALYRHIRLRPSRYWRLFKVRRNEFGEPEYERGASLHQLKAQVEARARIESVKAHETLAPEVESLNEQLSLLNKIQECTQYRGAPDPIQLFRELGKSDSRTAAPDGEMEASWNYGSFAQLYLHGLPLPLGVPERAVHLSDLAERPVAKIADVEAFVSAILNRDAISRREYIEQHALRGSQLPDQPFKHVLAQLHDQDAGHAARLAELDWLRDFASLCSPEQLLELYIEHDVLQKIIDSTRPG